MLTSKEARLLMESEYNYNNLQCCNKSQIDECILMHVAPILAKIKPATLVALNHKHLNEWAHHNDCLCKTMSLKSIVLCKTKSKYILLIYDPELLHKRLIDPKIKTLLKSFNYPESEAIEVHLDHLRRVYSDSYARASFPHEIGLFLGYPPEDVYSFIKHGGKSYLHCKYWKVYHNEENALATFALIDNVLEYTKRLIQSQIPIILAFKLLNEIYLSKQNNI